MLVVWIGLSSSYRYLMKEDSMCDAHVLEAEILAVPDDEKEKEKKENISRKCGKCENCHITGLD